jgi:hypothetical protein
MALHSVRCILCAAGTATQWPAHWGAWVANASVSLDYQRVLDNQTLVVDELAAIAAARVRAMQQTIAAHAHRLAYARGQRTRLKQPTCHHHSPLCGRALFSHCGVWTVWYRCGLE